MLLAVIAQLSFAQSTVNEGDAIVATDGNMQIIQIAKTRLQNKLLSTNKTESLKVNIPYISDEDLTLVNHDMLSDDFKVNYPNIRVYRWKNEYSSGRITVSPEALYINKIDECGITMLYPTTLGSDYYYVSNSYDESLLATNNHECEVDRSREAEDRALQIAQSASTRDLITNGSSLRTYRMAPIVTGEYYQENGGTNAVSYTHLTLPTKA